MCRTLRNGLTTLALLTLTSFSIGQDEVKKKAPLRFGFGYDDVTYSQQNPKDAMKAIVLAVDRKRVDYLLAQLADPGYVDYWVDRYQQDFMQGKEEGRRILAFERLVRETAQYYQDDPLIVKDLRVFAKEAKWAEAGESAVGTVDTIPARKVFLKKIGERWFLENKQQ
jgi:hypothetical protein